MRHRCMCALVVGAVVLVGSGVTFSCKGGGFGVPGLVWAEETWRTELEELCSRTEDAMNFGRDELKSLVERCDKLKPRIEALDESTRKVYGRRLQMCRDFYQFMLENKKAEGGGK
ncbi:MAG TPA: hypothetical protein VI389_03670 [Geobacteraceae bacterium]